MKTIGARTKLYCIFGNPVEHSLSPVMQNVALEAAGVDAVYMAFRPSSIGDAVAAMRTLPIQGASITIPYKTEVMNYIDAIDPLAANIGAVNTLHNEGGRIIGYNTDGHGAIEALVRAGVEPARKRVLILGNGGSARAIAFSLIERKCHLIIAGRNPQKFLPLVDALRKFEPSTGDVIISALDEAFMKTIDIVINTTSVGMEPDTDSVPIDERLILPHHTVFDIVYRPHWTALLKAAEKKNARLVFGIDMLLNQGARQFEIWTGMSAPYDAMKKTLAHAFEK